LNHSLQLPCFFGSKNPNSLDVENEMKVIFHSWKMPVFEVIETLIAERFESYAGFFVQSESEQKQPNKMD